MGQSITSDERMSVPGWEGYPSDYRQPEIQTLLNWVCSGECAALLGLSGSGKSNLLGFLAHRRPLPEDCPEIHLVDCNRLGEPSRAGFLSFLLRSLEPETSSSHANPDEVMHGLEEALSARLAHRSGVCFLLDRFDAIYAWPDFEVLANNLRALRDRFKYQLSLVAAARRPIDDRTELAELFFGRTLWLGPLQKSDALWSARRDLERFSRARKLRWETQAIEQMIVLSWGYPSLLRAVCEAAADGAALDLESLAQHPAVLRRVSEFWADEPGADAVRRSGLEGQPLLQAGRRMKIDAPVMDASQLTAKENLLLKYFSLHAGEVCEKDALIRAVWPEDVIYEQGIRDESLAQLIRRLRVKIEPDPGEPRLIQTVPGRGYVYRKF